MDERIRNEYFELLRIPSVGADPAHLADCVKCANWWKGWLEPLGFTVELLETAGNPPVVFAERPGDLNRPTALLYGHYDVQPVDPIELWDTPPFEPTVKGDRVYCRGANDDKGQTFAFLCGLRAMIERGDALPTIKVLLEGQEESGSTAMTAMAPGLKDRIRADVLLVCDTDVAPDGRLAIVAGLRGTMHFTIRMRAGDHDLHSGTHGGVAPNPAQKLCELVASLHNADNTIAVEGFMDGVVPPSDEERRLSTTDERLSFLPTIEVNGICSGYTGAGSKTIIPCEAFAKMSMRLVPGQVPSECMKRVEEHLMARKPEGVELWLDEVSKGAPGFRLPVESPLFVIAKDILKELDDGRDPVFLWEGASIPVISTLREISGAAPLLVGFGMEEDRIHAPNESYSFRQFDLATRWSQRIFAELR